MEIALLLSFSVISRSRGELVTRTRSPRGDILAVYRDNFQVESFQIAGFRIAGARTYGEVRARPFVNGRDKLVDNDD